MSKKDNRTSLRSLPGVDVMLALPEVVELATSANRELIANLAREVVSELREELGRGETFNLGGDGKIASHVVVDRLKSKLGDLRRPSLIRVINATGIILHTNLGRAPLGEQAGDALERIRGSYTNLEFELERGERGTRNLHLERLLCAVSGAEAGIAVNNNAAAVLLVLNTLASGREVIVSRGELIEIGGSFRIPEIIGRGFARLREVGTTNKTRLPDYAEAMGEETALLLKVHTSNYKIVGFTQSVSLSELVALGRERGIPVMEDLGSGLLIELSGASLEGEPVVRESIEAGADVVTFSGDKLLGGPQAGIIVGRKEIVEQVKKNPLMRALRLDKLTIAALEESLRGYLDTENLSDVNTVAMLVRRTEEQIESLSSELKERLEHALPQSRIEVEEDVTYVGGGSLPEESLPTRVVVIESPGMSAEELSRAFRMSHVPVVGRIRGGFFRLDVRTLFPRDLEEIAEAALSIAERAKE